MPVEELKELLAEDAKRTSIVDDCVALVDSEVRSKKGISGAAVKMAYKMVNAIKPRIIRESVDGLLDDFVGKMEPHYANYRKDGAQGTVESYFAARADTVADSLLEVTDERANRSTSKTMVKAYKKLRPKGKEHVTIAVPKVGAILDKYL